MGSGCELIGELTGGAHPVNAQNFKGETDLWEKRH